MAVSNVEVGNIDHEQGSVGAISGCDKLTTVVDRLLDRVERLEPSQKERGNTRRPERFPREVTQRRDDERTCWRCGRKGHLSGSIMHPGQPIRENWTPPV